MRLAVPAHYRDAGHVESACHLPVALPRGDGGHGSSLQANVLSEEIVLATLREVRERLALRSQATKSELPALQLEAERLRGEIGRLVEAIASGGPQPQALVEAVAERQERLSALDARLRAAQTAPEAISLEVRRLDLEARKRIDGLREALTHNPNEARQLMASLFVEPLRCTSIETPAGRRFQIEGSAVVGQFFAAEVGVRNVASPRGFEARANLSLQLN